VLAGVTVGFLIGLTPTALVRDELVRDVKAQTGRDLVVAGSTSLSLFPSFAVSMADVSLSPPPGMTGEPTVRIRRVDASVPFWSLFTNRVAVTRLLLSEPVFELRVDRQGRRTWDLAADPRLQTAQSAGTTSRSASWDRPLRPQSLDETAIAEIHIANGTVRYLDERTGISEEARSLELTISDGSPVGPIDVKGSLVWRTERLDIDARLASLQPAHDNSPVRVAFAVIGQRLNLGYQGSVTLNDTPQLDGALTVSAPSLKNLAIWLGASTPPSRDLRQLAFKSDIKTGPASLALSNADLSLGETSATGNALIDLRGVRPSVKANLKVTALDFDAHSPPASPAQNAAAPTGAQAPSPANQQTAEQRAWSEETIDLGPFGLADIEAKLAIGRLAFGGLKLGETAATMSLKDRVLKFNLDDARLYEGRGHGVISIDGANRTPAVGVNLALEGVSVLPMLADAAGFDWLAGRTNLQLALAGQGATERAIVASLSGSAAVRVVDGAIVGVNVPRIVRGMSQGRFSDYGQLATEKTDFSEMTATFRIANGIAQTQDLAMQSPLMRLAATGTVDIGQQQLDATLRPRLVGSLSGQGGVRDLTGLEIPVRLSGPWNDPQLSADIDAVLKDPDKTIDAIKQIGKQLQDSGVGEALRKLFGDGGSADKSGKSGSFLDELFK
jgi:AsmA protein